MDPTENARVTIYYQAKDKELDHVMCYCRGWE